MDFRKFDGDPFFNNANYCPSQHRPPHRSDSTDYGYEQDGNASRKGKDATGPAAGVNVDVIAGVEGPANACQPGSDGMRP